MVLGSTLGETAWAACESVIRRFEDAWRGRSRPDINSFLPTGSPHATQLLVELVHIDLEFRLRAGEPARAEEYLDRFPELRDRELALDLVAAEFAQRNRHCPPAWPEEFWLRFPEHIAELRARLPRDGGTGWFAATRPAEPPGAPLSGPPVIAGYEIQGELGRGGMGVVYKARDVLLHRTVAVKTFATVPLAESCERFAREAEAIARLDHPNIVPVYEVGEWHPTDGGPAVPYFVMKWYPGGSLDTAPTGPATDAGAQAKAVETIARAVHHAHQRGVLHRDLKPSNILLDDAGRPHVADFGLAGRVDRGAPTVTEIVAGTPAYMAPEQAGNPREVSTAADVYGLGAILYHQLTGRAPFEGETPLATLQVVATTPAPRPSAVNPAVPRDLDTITLKCLEKDPARRYASAAELADDLGRWREGLPIAARPARAWELAWRRVRRHPVLSGMAAVTLAALVGAVAVLAHSNARIREKERETAAAYDREHAALGELETSLAREERTIYLDRVTLAGRLYAANQLTQAWELLDQCPERFRGWEWRHLDSLRRSKHVALAGHTSWIAKVGFLPDGRLVSADTQGFVRVWDVAGRKAQHTWKFASAPLYGLAVHPTRNWVAVGDLNGVSIWNADTGRTLARLTGSGLVAFSPDGTRALTRDGPVVRLWVVPDAEPKTAGVKTAPVWESAGELRGHGGQVVAAAFTPDGKKLVTSALDQTIRTWELEAGKELASRAVPMGVSELTVLADGETLAEAHYGGVVFSDLATGRMRDRLDYAVGERTAVAAGPRPNQVAISGANGEAVVWDVVQRRAVRVYRGHTARISGLAFGPGGLLASSGGDEVVRVWDTNREQGVRTVAWVGDGVGGVAVSPDGARVAIGARNLGMGQDAASLVLNAATGRELHRFAGGAEVAFHPISGKLVAGRTGGGMRLLDPVTGAEVWGKPFPRVRGSYNPPTSGGPRTAITPDGSLLATWDRLAGGVQLFNAADGSDAGLIDTGAEHVYAIAFTADGKRLATATYDGLVMWDVMTRQRLPWAEGAAWTTTLAFSPDGRWLVTVDRDRKVRLREAATAREVRTFIGNAARVHVAVFSPDGSRVATGGSDRTVRVWDVESGRELLSLTGPTHGVRGLAWDAKNDRLYALDFAVRAWGTSGDE